MSALKLGVPSKGRLQEKTFEYFAQIGATIRRTGSAREYAAKLTGIDNIEISLIQAGEAPQKLVKGELHLAVTGEDLIRERLEQWSEKTALLTPMGFGRADLVVAVPNFWLDVCTMADLDEAATLFREHHGRPMRVATKYFRLTRAFFAKHGILDYRIVESLGATEGTTAAKTAELIVDITSSGDTIRANNLKLLSDGVILRSEANLCASYTASWSPTAKTALGELCERIAAREEAKQHLIVSTSKGDNKLIKNNDLQKIISELKETPNIKVATQDTNMVFGESQPISTVFLSKIHSSS